jgi:tetratricopeptide (TPR) repeat protein
VISFGLFDFLFVFLATQPAFMEPLQAGESHATSLFYFIFSLPMLLSMLVYFRFIMGFFMRNFERQADLYSAGVMGTPSPTITSLEKIAFLSGKIRDLPSWHHFSIRQRVDCLQETLRDPGLVRRHNRFVRKWVGLYVACLLALGYLFNFSTFKEQISYRFIGKAINQQLVKDPDNIMLHQNMAMIYHNLGKYALAMETYERILELDLFQPTALNNYAWLLVTVPDKNLRDRKKGLELAIRAAALKKEPYILDTLAEAYYANGRYTEAVRTIQEAIGMAGENQSYYLRQLKKFREARKQKAEPSVE